MTIEKSDEDHARMHTAHLMADYLLSLSHVCKTYGWHRTGLHVYTAGEELMKMLSADRLTQDRYTKIPGF
ncbi:MAG: hypothetical protein H6865_05000 [Rhodospirillales bacterium]|nr:hypothetical protein [Alphaproteobacteria bacterium]MCB9986975.1 hypothetical protein [Rhodospirillales bacterium]USO08251.1 MAG: hypothetical protein H6866_03290 [Rhodospirillales bacterium]